MYKVLIKILVIILLFGCEEEIEWNIPSPNSSQVAVDAILTNELIQQQVNIFHTISSPLDNPLPVSDAFVVVAEYTTSEIYDTIYYFTEDSIHPGIYYSNTPFRAVTGPIYLLYINNEENVYTASSYSVPVTPLQDYSLSINDSGLYSFNYIKDEIPSMLELHYDWTHMPEYTILPVEDCKASQTFYTLNSVDVPEFLGPEKEQIFFPQGTKIYGTKYSLSPEHEKFVRSMLLETDWRGGTFDLLPGNTYTNLSNGAVGFFAVSTVIRDSLVNW